MAKRSSKRSPAGSSRKRTTTRRRTSRPSSRTIRIPRGAPAVARARGGPGRETAILSVRIFDGRRGLIDNAKDVFVRILDGNQEQRFAGNLKAAVQGFEVPFFDNAGDNYAVLASKPGYVGAGFHGIKVSKARTEPIDLMLIPVKHRFNFVNCGFDALRATHPLYCDLLSALAPDARDRWNAFTADGSADGPIVADALNILTAMREIQLAVGTPLDYLKAIRWDGDFMLQQDRFYVWVDPELVNEVVRAADQKKFTQEFNPGIFHKGATRSYKENLLAEANIQLTFHENTKCTERGFEKCVLMEPDIDYFPDALSHGILEVVPGFFSKTDPRAVYVMRWISSRRTAGVQEFNPPYTIEAV